MAQSALVRDMDLRIVMVASYPSEVLAAIILSILLWRFRDRRPANFLIFGFLPMVWLTVFLDIPVVIHAIQFPGRRCYRVGWEDFILIHGLAVFLGLPTAVMTTYVAYRTR